ncbi:DUF6853 family protein [Herbaspirillum seropedicae]|uniref:DUF6853 family protein n=1 Tax=Herbaspirillum seropedicae TaxID=964 RepID=UPI003FCD2124
MIDIRRMDVIERILRDLYENRQLLKTEKSDRTDGDERSISSLDYDYPLGEKLKNELMELVFYFETHQRALKENDRLAAFFAIRRAGDLAQKPADLFGNIEGAVDKVMYRDPRFSWPSIPEGYQLPKKLLTAGADALKCTAGFGVAGNGDVLMLWENAEGKIEVIKKDSVDVIRKTFIDLAVSIGVSIEDEDKILNENNQFEWCINYAESMGDQLENDLDQFLLSFEVHRIAIQNDDPLAAYIALMDGGTYAQRVANLFLDIKDEIDKVTVLDKRFSWPVIPDGYQLPEHFAINPQR